LEVNPAIAEPVADGTKQRVEKRRAPRYSEQRADQHQQAL
jgi:hypothetical protein